MAWQLQAAASRTAEIARGVRRRRHATSVAEHMAVQRATGSPRVFQQVQQHWLQQLWLLALTGPVVDLAGSAFDCWEPGTDTCRTYAGLLTSPSHTSSASAVAQVSGPASYGVTGHPDVLHTVNTLPRFRFNLYCEPRSTNHLSVRQQLSVLVVLVCLKSYAAVNGRPVTVR
jgi:hypothetical protein